MSDIAPIGRPTPASYGHGGRIVRPQPQPVQKQQGDTVEFSRAAQLLSKLRDLPDIRHDLVDRIRGEIQAGTYETDDKIDATLEAMMSDLQD